MRDKYKINGRFSFLRYNFLIKVIIIIFLEIVAIKIINFNYQ